MPCLPPLGRRGGIEVMSDPFRDQPFPVGALIGAAALLAFTLLAVSVARLTGVSPSPMPLAPAVESRDVRFADRPDGAVLVYDAGKAGDLIYVVPPDTEHFLRGVLRGCARERRSMGASETVPFRLTQRADGSVTLEDLATHRVVDLAAFGPTNQEAFAKLLHAKAGKR
jgi:putative photosynthetic complex assembly protein